MSNSESMMWKSQNNWCNHLSSHKIIVMMQYSASAETENRKLLLCLPKNGRTTQRNNIPVTERLVMGKMPSQGRNMPIM